MMAQVKQTFLGLLLLSMVSCRRPHEPAHSDSVLLDEKALDLYEVTLNTDTVTPGQKVSVCFKAANAVSVSGFPGKFEKNGRPDGDCLVHAPTVDTMYRIEVTAVDGSKRAQTAFVSVRSLKK